MPAVLVARQSGLPLVNIAQIFQTSGQMIACRKTAGVEFPEDLRGKSLAITMGGNEYAVFAWLDVLGIPKDGSAQGVTISDRGDNVAALVDGTADCVSGQTYNELELLRQHGFDEANLTVFKFQDFGAATLQDGLYVTEAGLSDPAMADILARFIKASLKGWRVAVSKPESATDIVMDQITAPDASRDHQRYMIGEVRKLVGPTDDFLGLLVPADYDATVAMLTEAGIVSGAPTPAWTHSLWLRAQ
jgi:NitT/TauT family transport system substrate-binding protein